MLRSRASGGVYGRLEGEGRRKRRREKEEKDFQREILTTKRKNNNETEQASVKYAETVSLLSL